MLKPMRDYWNGRSQDRRAIVPSANMDEFWRSGQISVARLVAIARKNSITLDKPRVLDIGCGWGRMERWLSPHCRFILGLDVSPQMVAKAVELKQKLYPAQPVRFDVFNGVELPEIPASELFDWAFSWITIQHLPCISILRSWLKLLPTVLVRKGRAVLNYKTGPELIENAKNERVGIRICSEDWPLLAQGAGFDIVDDCELNDSSDLRVIVLTCKK